MKIGQKVEYQTGIAEFGIGTIVSYDDSNDLVTLTDDDDGSIWCGPSDRTTPFED